MRKVVALLSLSLLTIALPAAEGHVQQTHTRNVDAYYGTVQALDAGGHPVGVNSFLELTDHVTATLGSSIATEPGRDSRVTSNINAWVDGSVTDVQWIFKTPEGLDAAGNLDKDLTSWGGRRSPSPPTRAAWTAGSRAMKSHNGPPLNRMAAGASSLLITPRSPASTITSATS